MISKTVRTTVAALAVLAALLAGCSGDPEAKGAEGESQDSSQTDELTKLRAKVTEMDALQQKLKSLEGKLASTEGEMDQLKAREELAEKRLQTLKDLLAKLKGVIEAGDLSVRIKRGQMVLELPSAILFKSGEADLSDKGKETLDKVAAVLKEIKGRDFQVAGHTDNVRLSQDNPFVSNWHLSAARAVAVVEYLVEKKVRPRTLSAAGYSQYRPTASNKTAKGKARNRRISIALMPNLEELPDLTALEAEFGLKEPEEGY